MNRSPLQLSFPASTRRGRPAITGVAGKRLALVDLPGEGSNQHELNGVSQLRQILGDERIEKGLIRWLLLSDEEGVLAESVGKFTWYDAREKKAHRSAEYRLYYDSENLLEGALSGDVIILVAVSDGARIDLVAFATPGGSTLEGQLCWLLGLDPDHLDKFVVPDQDVLAERSSTIAALDLIELLGLARPVETITQTDLELVRRRFGGVFPPTADMSAFAREEAPCDPRSNPDDALLTWLGREEELFRALEEFVVGERLATEFEGVDDFISFSLSVHNRRKARMGRALENHLRAVFDGCDVSYSYNAITENQARPDFLFPGIDEYLNPGFPEERIFMLAAKSTCKDRWRQVLTEAARIQHKHLCTLEPGISETQTAEMRAHCLYLVVPGHIRDTYSMRQRKWLLSLDGLLGLVTSVA